MRISFAASQRVLLRGAHTLLVVGPAAAFRGRSRVLGGRLDRLLRDLASDAAPGDLGATASTLTQAKPRRLVVGALPDEVSRYNSPSRAESIRRVVSGAALGARGKAAVLLLLDDPAHVEPAVNAVGRALPEYSGKSGRRSTLAVQLLVADRRGRPLAVSPLAKSLLAVGRDTAELVDTPPTELDPAALEERARAALRGLGHVKLRTIVGDRLLAEGLRGIHAVGRQATSAPRLLLATYEPPRRGSARARHVALVGKGVTFDTGGLHIKARGMMETMKCDMGGAAAVMGAFRVLCENECPHRLSLVLCLAENAIGPLAYKPDDILELHSGKTVEINNTDAEGRLLLADGVSYAARNLRADVILDAATLTGAQLIATGVLHAAIVSNDADLERIVVEAGRRSGDLAHPLPFAPEFYKGEFKSPVADMRNSVGNRMNAQSACAAQFVYWHIEDVRTRWCHVDLAGPAFPKDRATGFGVALLVCTVLALA